MAAIHNLAAKSVETAKIKTHHSTKIQKYEKNSRKRIEASQKHQQYPFFTRITFELDWNRFGFIYEKPTSFCHIAGHFDTNLTK